MKQFKDFDRSLLNDYSERLLDRFLNAFPKEKIYNLQNTDKWVRPGENDDFIGAWVLEWIPPSGDSELNIELRSSEKQLIISWISDHEHFINFDQSDGDPEAEDCLNKLAEIFTEQVVHVNLFGKDSPYYIKANWLKPEEVEDFVRKNEQAIRYEVNSWRGTYDKVVQLEM